MELETQVDWCTEFNKASYKISLVTNNQETEH